MTRDEVRKIIQDEFQKKWEKSLIELFELGLSSEANYNFIIIHFSRIYHHSHSNIMIGYYVYPYMIEDASLTEDFTNYRWSGLISKSDKRFDSIRDHHHLLHNEKFYIDLTDLYQFLSTTTEL